MNASARLLYLKKVCKKVWLKEYRLVKQGLRELEADKQKELNSLKAELLGALVAHQSPLADSFVFDPFFLMLFDLLNSSTPVPFL